MSMSYFIYSDLNSDEAKSFPNGLSHFFEQFGGYEEGSEVAQIEKILNIDLSLFQEYNEPESEEIVWHEIVVLEEILKSFIDKIRKIPNFSEKVHHGNTSGKMQDEFMNLAQSKDTDKLMEFLTQIQQKPNANFPPDTGYLKKGQLLSDLIILEKMLLELKAAGAKKIKLLYM